MANEVFLIQLLTLLTLSLFSSSLNLLVLWYLAGLYLVLLGLTLLLNDGDLLVGFLWVIDLGVGLIFFIFILHYSSFLHQKSNVSKNNRIITFFNVMCLALIALYSFVVYPVDNSYASGFGKTWTFLVSWLDYYLLDFSPVVTDLNMLHEVYFVNNSFEFVLINFFLFYGIVSSILLSFLIKYIFAKLALPNYSNIRFANVTTSVFFVRNQNFLKQQSTSAGERIWVKRRSPSL